jgi:hypothetical protein
MNNQVPVDRKLLAEYLSGHGEDWVEAGHKLREILDATPAPTPDALQASAMVVPDGWIAVSERLPDETHAYGRHSGDVLCLTRAGKPVIALLAHTTTGDAWFDQQSQERDVTHWMPLPPAPGDSQ